MRSGAACLEPANFVNAVWIFGAGGASETRTFHVGGSYQRPQARLSVLIRNNLSICLILR